MLTRMLVLLALAAIGCGPNGSGASAPEPAVSVVLKGLRIDPDPVSMGVGGTIQFTATGHFSDGSESPVPATWSSGDPLIATITAEGRATGQGQGLVQIAASPVDAPALVAGAALTVYAVTPPDITTAQDLGTALIDTPYSKTLKYSGGTGSPSWRVVTGRLPEGLTLDPQTGILAGTATTIDGAPVAMDITRYDPATGTARVFRVGLFTFTVRLVTGDNPPTADEQEFRMSASPE